MLHDLLDDVKITGVEETMRGCHLIIWRTIQNLSTDNTPAFIAKLRDNVATAFYLRHIYGYELRNIKNSDVILLYNNLGSPWFNSMAEAEKWFKAMDEERLSLEDQTRNGGTRTF